MHTLYLKIHEQTAMRCHKASLTGQAFLSQNFCVQSLQCYPYPENIARLAMELKWHRQLSEASTACLVQLEAKLLWVTVLRHRSEVRDLCRATSTQRNYAQALSCAFPFPSCSMKREAAV